MSRLGIEMIGAYSPEAPGRSERMFRSCHDVKVHHLVLRRCDGTLALMHGPRKLAEYDAAAQLLSANHRAAA
jgi:hypothetical protein